MSAVIYTIGHSTRPIEEFLAMLNQFDIKKLVDVRTIPKSKRNPQFHIENLMPTLISRGIAYEHMPGLGGLRHPRKDSVNTGWRNPSFRGYADYMDTDAFKVNLQILMSIAQKEPTAIMCAEAVPWRCHRSLIADSLTVAGFEVKDIMSTSKSTIHKLNPMTNLNDDGKITYPSEMLFDN